MKETDTADAVTLTNGPAKRFSDALCRDAIKQNILPLYKRQDLFLTKGRDPQPPVKTTAGRKPVC